MANNNIPSVPKPTTPETSRPVLPPNEAKRQAKKLKRVRENLVNRSEPQDTSSRPELTGGGDR
jgi:hypothetical protein